MNQASRLGVGVIGAGRVGPVLGAALAGAGHALTGVTAGSDPDRVEAILPGVIYLSSSPDAPPFKNAGDKVAAGETVGLIGESGSGKTTLGQCVMRLLDVDSGRVLFKGQPVQGLRGAALKALRPEIQMIFQDPFASLNPRHRVGRIVTENAVLCGVTPDDARRRMMDVLAVVGLDPSAVNRYPHEFSGGQRQRIGIARALVMQPKLIVADEAVSALDVSVQQQVLSLLRDVRQRLNLSMLFITHDLRVASQICDRIAVMHKGQIVETGTVQAIARAPQHAYTRTLFEAMPGQAWEREIEHVPQADAALA